MFSHSSRVQTRSLARYPLIHQNAAGSSGHRLSAKAKVGSRLRETSSDPCRIHSDFSPHDRRPRSLQPNDELPTIDHRPLAFTHRERSLMLCKTFLSDVS